MTCRIRVGCLQPLCVTVVWCEVAERARAPLVCGCVTDPRVVEPFLDLGKV